MLDVSMPNKVTKKAVALFLFAHQDDEFGVFQRISDERQKGRQVCCAYLTDGSMNGKGIQRRNRESLFVLKRLGVYEHDVFFAGEELGISDAQLHEHLDLAAEWIRGWLAGFSQVVSIYVPAWEGGHHDHDVLHAITVVIAEERAVLSRVRQFSLYNSYRCVGPLFRILYPLPMNGVVNAKKIPWRNRLRFLRYCLSYPSQAKTWLGLFPFTVFHYLMNGVQALQPVSSVRLCQRPHNGALYYEKRSFFTWEKMASCLSTWQNRRAK